VSDRAGQVAELEEDLRLFRSYLQSERGLAENSVLAYGRDLSLGGIRFQMVGAEVEMGEHLRIYFNVEDETVSALGRVAWATEVDPFTTDVGLEFLEIDPLAVEMIGKLAGA